MSPEYILETSPKGTRVMSRGMCIGTLSKNPFQALGGPGAAMEFWFSAQKPNWTAADLRVIADLMDPPRQARELIAQSCDKPHTSELAQPLKQVQHTPTPQPTEGEGDEPPQ